MQLPQGHSGVTLTNHPQGVYYYILPLCPKPPLYPVIPEILLLLHLLPPPGPKSLWRSPETKVPVPQEICTYLHLSDTKPLPQQVHLCPRSQGTSSSADVLSASIPDLVPRGIPLARTFFHRQKETEELQNPSSLHLRGPQQPNPLTSPTESSTGLTREDPQVLNDANLS